MESHTLPLCFVDLETTGVSGRFDRVIEVAVIRYQDGKLLDEFCSLVNPECEISPFISDYTGITNAELAQAPTFAELAAKLHELLDGFVFVAHNVRFDYGFLKHEFERLEIKWSPEQLCTVKLSRKLYPQHRRHGLDALIERHGLACDARHRALGDAQVLAQFWELIQREHEPTELDTAVRAIMRRPSTPINIAQEKLDALPDACGVYLFFGQSGAPLYVGKSVNIRSRVLSHFAGDTASHREMRIAQQVTDVEYYETPGELSALLLESKLVKELLPIHNRALRRVQRYCSFELRTGPEGYLSLHRVEGSDLARCDWSQVYGVFRTKREAEKALTAIAKEHGLCHKHLGLEKTKGACFAYHLKQCRGACVGEEDMVHHNLRLQSALAKLRGIAWPFAGPVGLREHDEERDLTAIHLVDNWCIHGTAYSEDELADLLQSPPEPVFDRDSYKLLLKFLSRRESGIEVIKDLARPAVSCAATA